MSDPIEFYRSFQALLRGRATTGVLTSGMACVEYAIQQNTKDTDWIIAPGDIGSLVTQFGELDRGISSCNWRVSYRGLFGAPLDFKYLDGGWTSHLAAFDRQHRRICDAVGRHGLPPAPLGKHPRRPLAVARRTRRRRRSRLKGCESS